MIVVSRGDASEEDLRAAFSVFDENGDGVISPEELVHVISILGGAELSKEQAEQLMDVADSNGDGKIDYHEFAALMTSKKH